MAVHQMVKTKSYSKLSCHVCQCWYSGAYHLVTIAFNSKAAHTSCKPTGSLKLEEDTKQTFQGNSGRSWAYLHFHIHLQHAKHMAMSAVTGCQTCLAHQSLTHKAAGEHTTSSPKHRLSHTWAPGLPGEQGGNKEWMFGVYGLGFSSSFPQQAP